MYRRSISPESAPTPVRTVGSPAYFLGRPAEVWLVALRRRSPAAFRERE